ncbi:hypothetical protein IFM89_025699 [Coptis chinensis]|uniref:RBR-type E3 ubiquitin transferase n=1 Tax=Coptis chinensis TaxID=261450 RepID=A0A835H2L6_9MAGN|nr:hypothetical protein IFM89_025699 [Coptis chinensis]
MPRENCRKLKDTIKCWAHSGKYDIETAAGRPLKVETDTWCSSGGLNVDGGNLFIMANYRSILFDPKTGKTICKFPDLPGGVRNYPGTAASAVLPIKLNTRKKGKNSPVEVAICGDEEEFSNEDEEMVSARGSDDEGEYPCEEDDNNNDIGGYVSEEEDYGNNEDCGQNHTALCEADIRELQEQDVTELSFVLNIRKTSATILLCQYNWDVDSVNNDWFADEEKVRKKVGLMEKLVVYYSPLCWKGYITTSINDGPGCLTMRCPEIKCVAAVGEELVNKLVSDEEQRKYLRFLLRSYVEVRKRIKWCPALVVEFVGGNCDVSCNCKHNFCWNFLEEMHRPVECDTVAKWILKNNAESENVTWILANSKPCPKCRRPIQKNDGCMHMTCTPPAKMSFAGCVLEGEYDEEEKRREMAKSIIEKYTHNYERWEANNKSRTKAVADLHQAETVLINNIRDGQHESEGQVKFITEAWAQIIECRRVLQWTYAYGYYLPEDEPTKRQFFEYLQGEAEFWLERLHECAEKGLKRFLDAKEPEDYHAIFAEGDNE